MDDERSPLVSVIIPFYNSEKYIRQCLDSIIGQSYVNLEILCIDDGSTDSSSDVIKNYKDKRIKIIHQKNQGPGTARNTGMDACAGDYILFMDSDDYLHPDMIKKMIRKAVSEKCSIVMCKAFEFSDGDCEIRPLKDSLITDYVSSDTFSFTDLGDKVLQFAIGWNWDKIYSSRLLKDNGIRYPGLKNSEDLMVAYPAMLLSDRMCYVDERLVYHRVNNKTSVSNTRRKNPKAFIDSCVFLKQFMEDHDLFEGDVKRSYVNWVLNYSLWNMDTSDYRSKITIFRALKKQGLRSCGITSGYGESYFFITWHYKRLLCIENMPCHVFAIRTALDFYSDVGFMFAIKRFLEK